MIIKKYWVQRHPVKTALIFLGVLAIAFIAFVLWVGSLMFYDPTCEEWRPGMSEEEKILLAVKIVNGLNWLPFEKTTPTGEKYLNGEKPIPFANAEAILREQPNCCKLVSSTNPKDKGVVLVNYIGRYSNISAPIVVHVDFNKCK